MKKINKYKLILVFLIIFPLLAGLFIQLSYLVTFYQRSNILMEDNDSLKTQFLTYSVSNYVVLLEVDGLDIKAQVNITYDVSSGYKYNGFKRFICPELFPLYTKAYISENSIKVYDDDNNKLTTEYREFEGTNGKDYTEIKFFHDGFTGIKTFSMNFLMKNWVIERFGASDIHLFNIGTFSIPVKRAEYNLVFPENQIVSSVFSAAGGSEKTEKVGNKYIYTLVQTDDITNDISIRVSPNITNTPPWLDLYWIIMLTLTFGFIGIIILIGYRKYKIYSNLPEEEKIRRREEKEKRKAERTALYGCAGCGGGGCGGCGGGCGGCGG